MDELTREGDRPLSWAAENGHLDVIRCLVERRASMNLVSKSNSTPLHLAGACGWRAFGSTGAAISSSKLVRQPERDTSM